MYLILVCVVVFMLYELFLLALRVSPKFSESFVELSIFVHKFLEHPAISSPAVAAY